MAKQPPDQRPTESNRPRAGGKMTTQINKSPGRPPISGKTGAVSRKTQAIPPGGAGKSIRQPPPKTGTKKAGPKTTTARTTLGKTDSGGIMTSTGVGTSTSMLKTSGGSDSSSRGGRGGGNRDYRIRMSGMPLSVKFMVSISVSTGVLMLAFFAITYMIASTALAGEVRANGANQAKSAGKLCKVYVETVEDPQFLDALLKNPSVGQALTPFYEKIRKDYEIPAEFQVPNHPVMSGFRLADNRPIYQDRREFQEDLIRAMCHQYGLLDPQSHTTELGLVQDASDVAGIRFDWRREQGQTLVEAFLRYCDDTDIAPRSFTNREQGATKFLQLKADLKKYVADAQNLLKSKLQAAYHQVFKTRYIDTMVANNIVGVKFVRVDSASQQGVDEFEQPGSLNIVTGNERADNVVIASASGPGGVDALHFVHDFEVEISTRKDGKDEIQGRQYRVAVLFDEGKVRSSVNRLVTILLAIALLVVVVGICVSYFHAAKVTKPINSLVEDVIVIAHGDYTHRTRLKTSDEIGVLARTIDMMTEGLEEARQIAIKQGQLQHDINIAEEVVIHLLPDTLPKIYGYDIYAFYSPSKDVGGDYYDFYEIDPNHVGMIVADVSGKGIPGAMVMTMARSVLRYEAAGTISPRETFIRANRHIARDIKRGMFVTAFYLVLNTQTAEMTVASAGHNPLLLWRASTGQIEEINPNGIALGFDKGPIFERTIKEQKVQLYSGDRVVIYTDGVPEAMSPDGEEYGEEAFNELILNYPDANSNQLTNIVVDALRDHQGEEQHDDITIVSFKLL